MLVNGVVRTVRYGVAGLKDPKDLEGSIAKVVDAGYAACEVEFVKEFTLKEPEAERLGTIAAREGVRLSVHAPYFAQLTTAEPERVALHLGALHHSCHLAALMGAKIVVCHPGTNTGDAETVHKRGAAPLDNIGPHPPDF